MTNEVSLERILYQYRLTVDSRMITYRGRNLARRDPPVGRPRGSLDAASEGARRLVGLSVPCAVSLA
jgi:hypothetical protein